MKACTGNSRDASGYDEAYRLFCRDLATFLSTARTVWNYLIQLTNESGHRAWLDARLLDVICPFHRELANQDIHDRPFVLAIDQRVRVEGTMDIPMRPGSTPINVPMKITGLEGVSFYYNRDELETKVASAYDRVLLIHGRRPAVELALRYHEILIATVKSGNRRGRFP